MSELTTSEAATTIPIDASQRKNTAANLMANSPANSPRFTQSKLLPNNILRQPRQEVSSQAHRSLQDPAEGLAPTALLASSLTFCTIKFDDIFLVSCLNYNFWCFKLLGFSQKTGKDHRSPREVLLRRPRSWCPSVVCVLPNRLGKLR